MADDATLASASTVSDANRAAMVHLARGETVGRYVVLSAIGSGGMGIVYDAYDPELDRKIALKILHAPADSPETRRRLLGEAQAMARLSHPNTVAIHDVGEHAGRVFLALELVDGVTLRKWLRAEPRGDREILRALVDAGRGLAGAHRAGIVHRDFKPENVLIAKDGAVKVGDFGLAVMLDDPATDPSSSGRLPVVAASQQPTRWVGTPAYMAPEQHRREPVTVATDQFAFCVSACEALFGARPFQGDNANELASAILAGRATLARGGRSVSARLRRALLRGLLPAPELRWPSMDALVDEMEDATRPRHARTVVVAGIALVGVVYGAMQLDRKQRERECRRLGAETAAVWDSAAAGTAEAAMQSAGIATGDLFARVGPRLDAYVAELGRLRSDACMHADVEADRSPQWRASVDECLDEGRAAVATLVGVFAEPRPDTALRAVSAVVGLPLLTTCADDRVLARRAVPEDAEQRVAVALLREELAAIRLLGGAGRFDEVSVRTKAAAAAAAQLGYAPLVAEVAELEALVAMQVNDDAGAAKILEAAYYLSLSEAADQQALTSAISLVHTVGYSMRHHDAGLAWAKTAQALADRLGVLDDADNAELAANLGSLHHAAGNLQESVAAHKRALELRERIFGADDPHVAESLDSLANVYGSLGEGHEALPLHERALAIREQVYGAQHPIISVSLGNIGTTHARMGNLDAAVASLERSLAVTEATLGANHPQGAITASNLGVTLGQSGRYDEALRYAERALAIRVAVDPKSLDVAESLNNVGSLHQTLGHRALATDYYARAVVMLDAAPGSSPELHSFVLLNLSRIHLVEGRLDLAMDAASKAFTIDSKVFGESSARAGAGRMAIADVAIAQKDWPRVRTEVALVDAIFASGAEIPSELRGEMSRTKGELAKHDGDYAAAVEEFETLLQQRKEHERPPHLIGEAMMHVALALEQRGDDPARVWTMITEARPLLATASGPSSKALAVADAWLAAHPKPTP